MGGPQSVVTLEELDAGTGGDRCPFGFRRLGWSAQPLERSPHLVCTRYGAASA
ncbi:MAG: hypothetical protein WBE30_05365 [Candidatus Cybelea sp.]